MSWAFAQAPREPLFSGFREISYVLMPIAFVLLVCGFGRNPTIVGAEKLLRSEDPARGDVKSLIFFGTLLVLAALGSVSLDSRKKSNPDWARFASVTSHIPFQAVLEKRNGIVCYFATLSF